MSSASRRPEQSIRVRVGESVFIVIEWIFITSCARYEKFISTFQYRDARYKARSRSLFLSFPLFPSLSLFGPGIDRALCDCVGVVTSVLQ